MREIREHVPHERLVVGRQLGEVGVHERRRAPDQDPDRRANGARPSAVLRIGRRRSAEAARMRVVGACRTSGVVAPLWRPSGLPPRIEQQRGELVRIDRAVLVRVFDPVDRHVRAHRPAIEVRTRDRVVACGAAGVRRHGAALPGSTVIGAGGVGAGVGWQAQTNRIVDRARFMARTLARWFPGRRDRQRERLTIDADRRSLAVHQGVGDADRRGGLGSSSIGLPQAMLERREHGRRDLARDDVHQRRQFHFDSTSLPSDARQPNSMMGSSRRSRPASVDQERFDHASASPLTSSETARLASSLVTRSCSPRGDPLPALGRSATPWTVLPSGPSSDRAPDRRHDVERQCLRHHVHARAAAAVEVVLHVDRPDRYASPRRYGEKSRRSVQ